MRFRSDPSPKYQLVDINCLAYLVLIGILLVFFHQGVEHWWSHVFVHLLFAAAVWVVVSLGEKFSQNRWLTLFRVFYPVAVIIFAWLELKYLMTMITGDFWATPGIVKLDKLIFRVHPTVWAQKFYRPWLDELMSLFYIAYYLFLPLVALTLFCKGKRDATIAAFSLATLAYLSNFILFYLFPVLGPKHVAFLKEIGSVESTGYVFARVNRFIQAWAGVRGAAFPSSHIAGALVWTLVALRHERKLGCVLLPLLLGVSLSTIYLGYHHAVDPLSGLLWGGICYGLGQRILRSP